MSAVVACATMAGGQPNRPGANQINREAPEFIRFDLNQHPLDLKFYRGKVVLLNFWATWCAPCQVEMPIFVNWQQTFGLQGLQIIGISMDDDPELAKRAYRKSKLNYPVVMGDVKLADLYGGVMGLPETLLIDRRGVIRAEFKGEADLSKIRHEVRSLLAEH